MSEQSHRARRAEPRRRLVGEADLAEPATPNSLIYYIYLSTVSAEPHRRLVGEADLAEPATPNSLIHYIYS